MGIDLCELFETIVLPLESPEEQNMSAVVIPGAETHRLAKDSSGFPCILLRQSSFIVPMMPIRLQNLLVSYGVHCVISHTDGQKEEGNFTIIKCISADLSLYPHFLRILSPIVTMLGTTPSSATVRKAITSLVDLFQSLTSPSKKTVQGLWAELLVIKLATNPIELVAAWHSHPFEPIDFVDTHYRIEVKSSSNRSRIHNFSQVQLTPPLNTQLIITSLFVESVAGGLSLRRLYDDVRLVLASDYIRLIQFDTIFYATLGANWQDAMEECFDFELATESIKFFDSMLVPKIDCEIPVAVSDIRFTSDMSGIPSLSLDTLLSFGGLFASIVPTTP